MDGEHSISSESEQESSSSSISDGFDNSGDDDNIQGELGILPYQFEPLASVTQTTGADQENGDEPQAQIRRENSNWCNCTNCQVMASELECCCCHEVEVVKEKIEVFSEEENTTINCITDHPGFKTVCLDRYVLETAYLNYRQQYGDREHYDIISRFRYTAYRQLARWCWGYLGKDVRVVLPACAVVKIRNTYPSDNYTNFHFAG